MKASLRVAKSSNQLPLYLAGLAGSAALATTGQGAIVDFTNSGSFYQGLASTPDEPTVPITLGDGCILQLDPGANGTYLDLKMTTSTGGANGRFTGTGSFFGYPEVSLLHLGDAISANNAGSYPNFVDIVYNLNVEPAFTGNVNGYIGFVTDLGDKGWIEVAYNSSTGLFSWDGGAVATAGESLTAGQLAVVPEPSSAALLALAVGGMSMLRLRRKAA